MTVSLSSTDITQASVSWLSKGPVACFITIGSVSVSSRFIWLVLTVRSTSSPWHVKLNSKGKFSYNAVSSPMDCSKRLTHYKTNVWPFPLIYVLIYHFGLVFLALIFQTNTGDVSWSIVDVSSRLYTFFIRQDYRKGSNRFWTWSHSTERPKLYHKLPCSM